MNIAAIPIKTPTAIPVNIFLLKKLEKYSITNAKKLDKCKKIDNKKRLFLLLIIAMVKIPTAAACRILSNANKKPIGKKNKAE